MNYRTDLAIERKEMLDEDGKMPNLTEGIIMKKIDYGDDITVTRIEITDPIGEVKMEKPMGNYITIEAEGILEEADGIKDKVEKVVAQELKELIKFHYYLNVLVAGLGNPMVTPDALGPSTASKIKVTNHLFELFRADGDDEMSRVSCIMPGVTATTGMETAEIIKKTSELVKPEVIIVIDSLAARNIERVSTTIQITDTGISPGAGMGNNRTGINEETMGIKVIAIGVPTVIDATTIIRDALIENIESIEKVEKYIEEYDRQMIVTSTDIDMLIKDFSDIIANGINKTLHPGIYS
ncbi:GPR endopeptidase [Mogibacterium sp. NSJ-24]|uniref:Germination protease n=1 Tax=Lentihominibacter hominis TaxID=2763645 RepID=A0A926EC38_9FIRM|nr:GPR endopeptidase [Lentihominibacter hominis]MBC8569037.1 GPR endopeptidase [Lentihominibacter hominis]